MSTENINSLLTDFIINQVNNNKWSDINGKKVINFTCSPMQTNFPIHFSHVKLSIEKINEKYKGSVLFESDLPFMRPYDEDDDDVDYDEMNQQTFYTNAYSKLGKCVKKLLELYDTITLCRSCNSIYQNEQNNNSSVCCTCLLQIFYHRNSKHPQDANTCSICLDENASLLPYTLKCDHTFHFSCLAKMNDAKCPLCRREFKI